VPGGPSFPYMQASAIFNNFLTFALLKYYWIEITHVYFIFCAH